MLLWRIWLPGARGWIEDDDARREGAQAVERDDVALGAGVRPPTNVLGAPSMLTPKPPFPSALVPRGIGADEVALHDVPGGVTCLRTGIASAARRERIQGAADGDAGEAEVAGHDVPDHRVDGCPADVDATGAAVQGG